MKRVPSVSLAQVYPPTGIHFDLNCCPDPDCPNFGVRADTSLGRFLRGASTAGLLSNSAAVGYGRYKLHSTIKEADLRVSTALEYASNPRRWFDGRTVMCQHMRMKGPCGASFSLLSNAHFDEELTRLRSHNGVLDGPRCGACGTAYLDAPEEFAFNGANGKTEKATRGGRRATAQHSPIGLRVIHKPCRGAKGARFTITPEHLRHRKSADNVQILTAIVNGAGLQDIQRMLAPTGSDKACGVSRVYERLYWLERTMLAFEREQLRRWKQRTEAKGKPVKHRLAHDDVILGVNWETSEDRRLTQLACSITADADSGYVYRIDVDFDPRVEPVTFLTEAYLSGRSLPDNLRYRYRQKSGRRFTAPRMHFQRPSGRFDEHHLFAAAIGHLRLYLAKKIPRMPIDRLDDIWFQAEVDHEVRRKIAALDEIHRGYFDLPAAARDTGTTFSGVMTRAVYTKAAHFAALREMLPEGEIVLCSEQEATLPRSLPHVFREEIAKDRLTWLAVSFDKEASKPKIIDRVAKYRKGLAAFIKAEATAGRLDTTKKHAAKAQRSFIAAMMSNAHDHDRFGRATPRHGTNYQIPSFPQLWLRSPIQSAGETEKVVGFPLVPRDLRQRLKSIPFDGDITDPATREEVGKLIWGATLQPVSTFINSLRERVSFARRAGGRATRIGPSFVNGAVYNPRILIAVLNIYRVWFNFFEPRQYVAPWNTGEETERTEEGVKSMRIPGSDRVITVPKRRKRKPVHRTPAMRHGIQEESRRPDGELILPSLHRMLYRPWLFAETPVWDKFENHDLDLRARRYRA